MHTTPLILIGVWLMKKKRKLNGQIITFLLLVLLLIIYKSIDNLSAVGEFFSLIFNAVKPFVIAFLIAYILNMPRKNIEGLLIKTKVKFLNKHSKKTSILLVYLFAIIIISVTVRTIVPAIYENCLDLYKNAPVYMEKIMNYVNSWLDRFNLNIISLENVTSAILKYIKNIDVTEFSKYAQGVINLTAGLMNTFISIIASIYMLIDYERIIKVIKHILAVFTSSEKAEKTCKFFKRVNNIFSKYIYCKIIEALIVGLISIVVLFLLDVKYALMLGVFIAFFNLIPYFGSIISSIFVVLITLVTGGIFQAIWTAITLLILEQIDGNIIGPKIMNNILNIRPLWVIVAVTVFGKLFGIVGMLISVPVLVVIKMMAKEYIGMKEQSKLNEQTEQRGE